MLFLIGKKYYLCYKLKTMSSKEIFESLGDFILWTTQIIYENIGNVFNYAAIVLGFVGLFYWLNYQRKFNAQAENDPNQIK